MRWGWRRVRSARWLEEVLELKRLGRFFSAVVTDSDIKHGKPAPDIFLRAAELLKVAPPSLLRGRGFQARGRCGPRRRHAGHRDHQHPSREGAATRHAGRADLQARLSGCCWNDAERGSADTFIPVTARGSDFIDAADAMATLMPG